MKKLCTVTTHRSKDGGGTEDQPTVFGWDGIGRPTQIFFPDGSTEVNAYLNAQLTTWKNRKDITKTIEYDARGREISHSWNDNGITPGINRQWDKANRLSRIANSASIIDYTYDAAAQIVTEINTVTGADGPAQLTYYRYPNGSVAQLGYPNNVWVRRDYTARGQLERVSDSATGWKMAVEYTYLDDGKVACNVYGDNTRTDYQYDGRGFMSSFRTYIPASNQEIYRRNYFRDERDRITIIQRGTSNQANAMENGHGDRFRYDAEGQMVEAWYDAPNPLSTGYGNARYELFNYDQLGNREGWACLGRLGWQEFSRKDNKLNQYSMWSPFSVIKQDEDIGAPWGTPQHANGVTMQEGNVTAGYNALNQMMMVNTAGMGSNWMFFGYDPLGRRVQQWVGQLNPNPGNPPNYVPAIGNSPGTFFYYDGWNLVQEGPAFNSASRNYVHGARVDEIVKQITPDNWYERYFHYEGRGHCAFQTDIWGNVIEQYDYDAFGQPYFYYASGNPMTVNGQPGSLWGNRFLFTGREYLADGTFPDLRLYDFRNRMYQPELGRFMSPDPKHFEAGDYNLYRYCHNDPVNKSDPFGLEQFRLRIVLPVRTGSQLKREVTRTFEGYRSAILAGKAGGRNAADAGTRIEMHGRIAQVDSAPGWYIYGPAVPGIVSGTQNKSAIHGEEAGPLPSGTTDVGMYWVLGSHQDPYSWPVNKENGLSDGQVLRMKNRTGVLTNPPPKGGGQFTYHWYDATTKKEGY